MKLPSNITRLIADEKYQQDEVGMSDSQVLLFHDKVLKVQRCGREADTEYRMLIWLKDKAPVPEVFAYEEQDGKAYLLIEKCSGEMACAESYMKNPGLQMKLLAEGLQKLWQVDISDCPCDWRLGIKLEQAKYNVENGLVDLDNVEPETFGENGFENPKALLQWLYDNQPEEELVLSHGDYCLPNVFFKEGSVSGFIDLGKTGIADKWCDIALCYRSLMHNAEGKYGGGTYSGYEREMFFAELGLEPDWEKIRYYLLLDELF